LVQLPRVCHPPPPAVAGGTFPQLRWGTNPERVLPDGLGTPPPPAVAGGTFPQLRWGTNPERVLPDGFATPYLGGDDVEGDRKLHLWLEPDHDLVETDLLDRLLDVNLAALELDTGEPVAARDHVAEGHRAVGPGFVTGV